MPGKYPENNRKWNCDGNNQDIDTKLRSWPEISHHLRPRPRPYGIIFNWDGTPHGYSQPPQSLDRLLEMVYAPLRDTQVGAVFWCVGTHEATWPSQTLPFLGDAEEQQFGAVKNLRRSVSVRALWASGENPHEAIVKRGHDLGIAVYASIRINDNHFWSDTARHAPPLHPQGMDRVRRPGLTALRRDHPEWCLGSDDTPEWAATSWNLAIPEVRQHLFDYISEACHTAPWDGVELDWQRHAFHLPQQQAYRLRYALTDLQRAVRQLGDEISEARGRPFHVAIRVSARLESCHRAGYDLGAWLDENLCDIVSTGANSGIDPDVEVDTYRQLGRKYHTQIYPGLDSHWEAGKKRLLPPAEWLSAWYGSLAKKYYGDGAQGIYIFNMHATHNSHRHLLTSLGSPHTAGSNGRQIYDSTYRFTRPRNALRHGAERDDRLLGEVPVPLYPAMTGRGPIFNINLPATCYANPYTSRNATTSNESFRVKLQIEIQHLAPNDKISVHWDTNVLPSPQRQCLAEQDNTDSAEVDENTWLLWDLKHCKVFPGLHIVEVVLIERDQRLAVPLVIKHVELHLSPVQLHDN